MRAYLHGALDSRPTASPRSAAAQPHSAPNRVVGAPARRRGYAVVVRADSNYYDLLGRQFLSHQPSGGPVRVHCGRARTPSSSTARWPLRRRKPLGHSDPGQRVVPCVHGLGTHDHVCHAERHQHDSPFLAPAHTLALALGQQRKHTHTALPSQNLCTCRPHLLGVPKDSDKKTIKTAYRQKARKYHPVRVCGPAGGGVGRGASPGVSQGVGHRTCMWPAPTHRPVRDGAAAHIYYCMLHAARSHRNVAPAGREQGPWG